MVDAVASAPPENVLVSTGLQQNLRRFIEATAFELDWGSVQWVLEGVEESGGRSTDVAMEQATRASPPIRCGNFAN